MINFFLILLIIFFSNKTLAGEDNILSAPKVFSNISIDEDGFEIISDGPSFQTLGKINEAYQKDVKGIFLQKCLTCHGASTKMPWYYSIPGVKQLMDSDVKEAKKHMDMSNDFPFVGHGNPLDDLHALDKSISKGNMPPIQYRLIHWNSSLNANEIKAIKTWIENSKKIIESKTD